eukprot:CAMPEP_0198146724 /NCGR_PEP_ID=MMETSP1443-20131203/31125_1 /TAXON_ID=186043 /ORGANISM="Entomoneis sp., Strain CCMP2396" /LENGTH=468 /DNA_ID=CAMNT_0043810785 /DNA_START=24 /DNA_END=1430 /DNA_ORIENTATION=-
MAKGQKKGKTSAHHHQQQHQHQQHQQHQQPSQTYDFLVGGDEDKDAFWDSDILFGEGSPSTNSLYFFSEWLTWREVVQIAVFFCFCATFSIIVGVAAGLAISIHSLDSDDAMIVLLPKYDQNIHGHHRPRGPARFFYPSSADGSKKHGISPQNARPPPPQPIFHHSRVTIWDSIIARHNLLASGSDPMDLSPASAKLGKRENMYPLVEQSPHLVETYESATVNNSNSTHHTRQPDQKHVLPWMDPPHSSFELYSKIQTERCDFLGPNGDVIYGYNDWGTLAEAFQEASLYSAERFMRWNKYFATLDASKSSENQRGNLAPIQFQNPMHFYDEDIILTVCPHAVIRARRGPVSFVNSGNIVLECYKCTVEVTYGSHFEFGPHAKNILFRGITLRGASSTSLLFHYDGADVSLEDCYFVDNKGPTKNMGTVADVNSSSVVNFYRCLMKNAPNDRVKGITSLSIRARDTEL